MRGEGFAFKEGTGGVKGEGFAFKAAAMGLRES